MVLQYRELTDQISESDFYVNVMNDKFPTRESSPEMCVNKFENHDRFRPVVIG